MLRTIQKAVRAFTRSYGKALVNVAFRWKPGRQNTGYEKMLLATGPWPVPFDCYLLRYPEGSSIPAHRDPAPEGKRHFRMNLVLRRPPRGGTFLCSPPPLLSLGDRLHLFRSDTSSHSVSQVLGGARYVLSLGALLSK